MSTAIDGMESYGNRRHALAARRQHLGKVRELYEGAIYAKRLESGGELSAVDMAGVRREVRAQLEREQSRRTMVAIAFLVIVAALGAVIFMKTFG